MDHAGHMLAKVSRARKGGGHATFAEKVAAMRRKGHPESSARKMAGAMVQRMKGRR